MGQIVRVPLPVYTFQIDNMGHVSNIVFIEWMEILRLRLLEEVGLPVHEIAQSGFGPVLVETQISYRKQIRLGDEVTGELWLSELKGASATMEIQFVNGAGEVLASGRQRGIFMDFTTQRPKRMDEDVRRKFEAYLAESAKG